MENVELVSITPNAMELLKQVAAACYQVPPSEREGAIAMDKTKAADKARRIAENLSGYAADFHLLCGAEAPAFRHGEEAPLPYIEKQIII